MERACPGGYEMKRHEVDRVGIQVLGLKQTFALTSSLLARVQLDCDEGLTLSVHECERLCRTSENLGQDRDRRIMLPNPNPNPNPNHNHNPDWKSEA